MGTIAKPRVLLAEDEAHCRMLMKAVLASMNCDVVGEARTGVEAVELYEKLKPDMMLLDINMPFKSGDEVLKDLAGCSPQALVIMLTSVADMDTIGNCIALGAANFIRKDTPVSEIRKIIKETWSTLKGSGRD